MSRLQFSKLPGQLSRQKHMPLLKQKATDVRLEQFLKMGFRMIVRQTYAYFQYQFEVILLLSIMLCEYYRASDSMYGLYVFVCALVILVMKSVGSLLF